MTVGEEAQLRLGFGEAAGQEVDLGTEAGEAAECRRGSGSGPRRASASSAAAPPTTP